MARPSAKPWLLALLGMLPWAGPRRATAQSPPAPPSSVSPAIERFAAQSGRSLPPPSPLPPQAPPLAPDVGPRPDPLAPPDARAPLSGTADLKPAPTQPTDRRFPINLAAALRLSDARPLVVAAAQAGVWTAEADLTRAKVLWVPTLNLGFDYIRHDGGGPDFNKGILTAPSVNFLYAGGGLIGILPLTDAIFEPLVARQNLNAAHWDVQAAKNDALLQTSDAYFRVHQARGTYAGALYAVEQGRKLSARISSLAGDLVPRVEVDRSRNLVADLEQRAAEARQEWRVQSANLTQVLRLDPRAVVEPMEHDHAQITLIDPGKSTDELLCVAQANRPELGSRQARVLAAEAGIRREKARMVTPTVLLNGFQTPYESLQAGIFGTGPNSSLNQWTGRVDVSVQALWQLEGLGIGNLARIKAQRGREARAIVELRHTQDAVAADVIRAQARLQAAVPRVFQAERALRTGLIAFKGQLEGLGQTRRFGDLLVLTYRPQEVIYSLDNLNTAFNEYFATVADYNRSQFELFHALGYPAHEVAALRTPGQAAPVDTSRPTYLPPVGNGPPPATR